MLIDKLEAEPRSCDINSERTDVVHSKLALAVEIAFSMVFATSVRAS